MKTESNEIARLSLLGKSAESIADEFPNEYSSEQEYVEFQMKITDIINDFKMIDDGLTGIGHLDDCPVMIDLECGTFWKVPDGTTWDDPDGQTWIVFDAAWKGEIS